MFVKGNIKKAVEDLNVSFNHLLGDVKPELHQKIEDVTKSIVTEINNNCQEGIIAVNKVIEDNLTIPENVLLYSDRLHATNPTQADVDVLSEECQRLEQSVKEVNELIVISTVRNCIFLISERFFHSRAERRTSVVRADSRDYCHRRFCYQQS